MKHIEYLRHLLQFAFRRNPLLYVSLLLSLVSVVVELAAMSSLFPLSVLALGKPLDAELSLASGGWVLVVLKWLGTAPSVRSIAILFVSVLLVRIVTMLASQWLILLLGKRLHAQLSSAAFDNIVRHAPIQAIDEKSVGYFITLAGDESFRASNLVIAISQFTGIAALGVLYFASIAYFSLGAAVFVAIFLALSFVALFGSFRESHRLGGLQVEQSQQAGSIFIDALNGIRAVRAMTAEGYVTERYRSEIFRYVRTLYKVEFANVVAKLAPVALLVVFGIALLWRWDESSTEVQPAFVFVLLMYFMRFLPVVGQALRLFMQVLADARAGQDILRATAPPLEPPVKRNPLNSPVTSIEIRQIDFEYSADKPVLKNFSLSFQAGRSYAIIGRSGSGKSTLLDLIMTFRAPSRGAVLVNGNDAQSIEPTSLRSRIALVSQQSTIFNDSLLSNVLFGAEKSREAVEGACGLAQLDQLIESLPEGAETKLTYQGSNLSGGQRQRIGLARAFVRDPDVVILDESTNALDRETRTAIVIALLERFRNRIVVMVTHDAEIAALADEVVDLDGAAP